MRRVIRVLLAGLALGSVFGAIEIGMDSLHPRHFLAALAAGGAVGLMFGAGLLAVERFRAMHPMILILGAAVVLLASGAAGGLAWWFVVRPDRSALWTAGAGALGLTLWAMLEGALELLLERRTRA